MERVGGDFLAISEYSAWFTGAMSDPYVNVLNVIESYTSFKLILLEV
jgi:hypothetical protein